MRLLVLCTHNSARSQMAEGWLRHYAAEAGLEAEVWSAGTERTRVKDGAIRAMREVGIDLSGHTSKTLWDVPDPWSFDVVLTVCDSANEACPAYTADTLRLHVGFEDPSGGDEHDWRRVRDQIGRLSRQMVALLQRGEPLTDQALDAARGQDAQHGVAAGGAVATGPDSGEGGAVREGSAGAE